MSKKRDEAELRRLEVEAEPEVAAPGLVRPGEIDVAESRWDPWLLARIEAQSETRVN